MFVYFRRELPIICITMFNSVTKLRIQKWFGLVGWSATVMWSHLRLVLPPQRRLSQKAVWMASIPVSCLCCCSEYWTLTHSWLLWGERSRGWRGCSVPAGFRRSYRMWRRTAFRKRRQSCYSCSPNSRVLTNPYEEVMTYQRPPQDPHRLIILVGERASRGLEFVTCRAQLVRCGDDVRFPSVL